MIGQSKRLGMWVNFQSEEKKTSSEDNFSGRVVEVHSGDCLTVEREADLERIRLFLTSVKAPKEAKPFGDKGQMSGESEPLGWESKESLRKLSIGKKVRVEIEYSKMVPSRTG